MDILSNSENNALAALLKRALNNGVDTDTNVSDEPVEATQPEQATTAKSKLDMTANLWLNMYPIGSQVKLPTSFMLWSNNRRQQAWIDLLTSEGYWGKDPLGVVFLREYGKTAVRFSMNAAVDVDEDGKDIVYSAKQRTQIENAVNAAYDEIAADNIAPTQKELANEKRYGKPIGVLVAFMYELVDNKLNLVQVPGVQKLRNGITKDRQTVANWKHRESAGLKIQIKARWNDHTGEKNADINIGHVVPSGLVLA